MYTIPLDSPTTITFHHSRDSSKWVNSKSTWVFSSTMFVLTKLLAPTSYSYSSIYQSCSHHQSHHTRQSDSLVWCIKQSSSDELPAIHSYSLATETQNLPVGWFISAETRLILAGSKERRSRESSAIGSTSNMQHFLKVNLSKLIFLSSIYVGIYNYKMCQKPLPRREIVQLF